MYREAIKYAEERAQFGKEIIHFPAVYEMLVNMKVRVDALRSLLYETTRFVDISKVYEEVKQERSLQKEERMEMKQLLFDLMLRFHHHLQLILKR